MHPLIFPSSFILVNSAASTVAGIFGLTTSTAARGATFGLSIPQAFAISKAFSIILTFSSKVGYIINA